MKGEKMSDVFWKRTSFILVVVLVVVVASWATGTPKSEEEAQEELIEKAMDQGIVMVEGDKQRYFIFGSGSRPTENDKIILYDSWDLPNTNNIWILRNPHTDKAKWARMSFDKR
jgi:hypothetical protein